jgi:hypothetical protein
MNGGNDVDYEALKLLAKWPAPRLWLSDGQVCGGRYSRRVRSLRACNRLACRLWTGRGSLRSSHESAPDHAGAQRRRDAQALEAGARHALSVLSLWAGRTARYAWDVGRQLSHAAGHVPAITNLPPPGRVAQVEATRTYTIQPGTALRQERGLCGGSQSAILVALEEPEVPNRTDRTDLPPGPALLCPFFEG